jgi:hypothetical protein
MAHLISYDEELAHMLTQDPAEIIPLVRGLDLTMVHRLLITSSSKPHSNGVRSASFILHNLVSSSLNTNSSFTLPHPSCQFVI